MKRIMSWIRNGCSYSMGVRVWVNAGGGISHVRGVQKSLWVCSIVEVGCNITFAPVSFKPPDDFMAAFVSESFMVDYICLCRIEVFHNTSIAP